MKFTTRSLDTTTGLRCQVQKEVQKEDRDRFVYGSAVANKVMNTNHSALFLNDKHPMLVSVVIVVALVRNTKQQR
jgi:hypothetical protein